MVSIADRDILTQAMLNSIQTIMDLDVGTDEFLYTLKALFPGSTNGKYLFPSPQRLLDKIEQRHGEVVRIDVEETDGFIDLNAFHGNKSCPDSAIEKRDWALGLLVNNDNSELLRTYLSFN